MDQYVLRSTHANMAIEDLVSVTNVQRRTPTLLPGCGETSGNYAFGA